MSDFYPIEIHKVKEEDGSEYFFAFHPDFGACACSATGDTIDEAVKTLDVVRTEIMEHFRRRGHAIPKPSPHPWESNS